MICYNSISIIINLKKEDFKLQENTKHRILYTIKYLIAFLTIGTVSGIIGTAFSKFISLATKFRTDNTFLIWFLFLGGILIILINKLLKTENIGTDHIIKGADEGNHISGRLTISIFISSVLSHLFGASVGREGAALQIGGSSASYICKLFKLENAERVFIYCGMAGVFSAVFGTPLTAFIFALEVVFIGKIYLKAVIPTFISSITAYIVAIYLSNDFEKFEILQIPKFDWINFLKIILLSILCAVLGMVFCLSLKYGKKFMKYTFKNSFARIIAGGVLITLLTFVLGTFDYNGAGMDIIENVIQNEEFSNFAFLFKLIFTTIAVSSGFKGGEIVPTLFIGATFGGLLASLLGLPISFGGALGMVFLFCSVTNCPIASIFLFLELFSVNGIQFVIIPVFI